jgi:hypothetical protein
MEWKKVVIEGVVTDYSVSDYGLVRRDKTGKILKPAINKPNGYLGVLLYVGKKTYYRTIHRLVAEAFIENTNNKKTVNHIDLDKHNNHIDNLEWLSLKENIHHYHANK